MGRQQHIDKVAGLLIINMIVMHCFHNADLIHSRLYAITYPLFFFMPWFFYKAGKFYSYDNTIVVIKNNAKKLLIPFCVFSLAGYLVHTIRIIVQGNLSLNEYVSLQFEHLIMDASLQGNEPLWFLLVLFVVKITYSWVNNKFSGFLLFILCFLWIVYLYYSKVSYPYYLASIPSGIIFYMLGDKMRNIDNDYRIITISIIVYIITAIFGWNIVDMHWNVCNKGHFLFWIPTSLAGIIVINSLFEKMPWKLCFLEMVGKNAMLLYATHWIIIEFVLLIAKDILGISNLYKLFLLLIIFNLISLSGLVLISNKLSYNRSV
jgi:fucose 4-O-acetylase-like acetyltransferase